MLSGVQCQSVFGYHAVGSMAPGARLDWADSGMHRLLAVGSLAQCAGVSIYETSGAVQDNLFAATHRSNTSSVVGAHAFGEAHPFVLAQLPWKGGISVKPGITPQHDMLLSSMRQGGLLRLDHHDKTHGPLKTHKTDRRG